MNLAHLHLALNHFPIIGTILGFLVLIAGMVMKNSGIRKAALGIFVFSAIMALPAFLTGEGAEHVLKPIMPDVEDVSQHHEDLGEIAIWICSLMGLVALAALIFENSLPKLYRILLFSLVIISIGNGILLKYVGTTGGEVRHTEIRSAGWQPGHAEEEAD